MFLLFFQEFIEFSITIFPFCVQKRMTFQLENERGGENLTMETTSDAGKVRSGVPQGSIIGPLLFTLFYNDLPSCLKHSEVIIYADDTVIFVPGKDIEIIEARLSADMKRVYEWCTDNELILNLQKGKTESMLFGTSKNLSQQPSVLNISFGDKTVNFYYKI